MNSDNIQFGVSMIVGRLLLIVLLLSLSSGLCWSDNNQDSAAESPVASAEEIGELVEQLGNDRYVLREQAQARLEELGAATFDALANALNHDDLEVTNRVRFLLGKIRFNWSNSDDPPIVQELLKNFATKEESRRIAIIDFLAENDREGVAQALCRIVRYDRSHRVSKRAALAMMLHWMPLPEMVGSRDELILRELGDTTREAADWYRTFAKARAPQNKANSRSWLEKLQSMANAEHRNTVAGQEGTGTDVASRFRYLVADMYATLGDSASAEANADAALLAGGGNAEHRLEVIPHLELRGHFAWAEREYNRVMEIAPGNTYFGRRARRSLCDMLHDQGRTEEAASNYRLLMELIKKPGERFRDLELGQQTMQVQMHYLDSLRYEKQGDFTKQAAALETAAKGRSSHPDVLISLYRLKNRTDEERATDKRRIQSAITNFRTYIQQVRRGHGANRFAPGSISAIQHARTAAQAHNQFAWLVGNTFGEVDPDLADEAIKASHTSLKYRPQEFAFMDTLARCYYARGDLDSAIKYQKQALALNPHSGLLLGQLKLFEDKLAESNSATP